MMSQLFLNYSPPLDNRYLRRTVPLQLLHPRLILPL